MRNKLFISDDRMLKLMDYAIKNGLVKNQKEYCERIQFAKNSLPKVKEGIQGFTKDQILRACLITGASADWIFGFSNEIRRRPRRLAIDVLKDAVFSLEEELINGANRKVIKANFHVHKQGKNGTI